jgi:hypothetical protein
MEYNRARHSETGEAPAERFLRGPDVGRPSPTAEELRLAIARVTTRDSRRIHARRSAKARTDGTAARNPA